MIIISKSAKALRTSISLALLFFYFISIYDNAFHIINNSKMLFLLQ